MGFLHGLQDIVSLAAAPLFGASFPDRFTLATEFATRNIAVAAAIALTLAGRVEFAHFGTAYFLIEIPVMLAATVVYRRQRPT